jgi:hypothetical protein
MGHRQQGVKRGVEITHARVYLLDALMAQGLVPRL